MSSIFADVVRKVPPDAGNAVKKKQRAKVPRFTIPPARKKNIFSTLPGELRNNIYKLAFDAEGGRDGSVRIRFHSGWNEPALLRVAKAYRREAMPIYYKRNEFLMRLEMAQMGRAADWLRTIQRMCGTKPFGSFSFVILDEPWPMLELLKPLVIMIAETGLTLTPNRLTIERKPKTTSPNERKFTWVGNVKEDTTPEAYVLWPARSYGHATCTVLRQSLLLAQRAQIEQWSSFELFHSFYKWVDEKNQSRDWTASNGRSALESVNNKIHAKVEMLEEMLALASRDKTFRLGSGGSGEGSVNPEKVQSSRDRE